MRPLPSRNGWMVSNCTCASAALSNGGTGSGSSFRNRSSGARYFGTSSAGGGTNTAFPGRVPPIHTCVGAARPASWPSHSGARAAPYAFRTAIECTLANHREVFLDPAPTPRRSDSPPGRPPRTHRAPHRPRRGVDRRARIGCLRSARTAPPLYAQSCKVAMRHWAAAR